MICTHPPCDRPCETYLCNDCTQELHDHWSQIPDLVPVLTLIMRGQEKAFHQPTAEGRGSAAGSKAPINVSALSLAQNLIMARNTTPNEYAGQSDGWQSKERIEAWVTLADKMVNGEEEDKPSPDYVRYKLVNAEPRTTKRLVKVFNEMGIKLKPTNISTWAHNGEIERCNPTEDEDGKRPHPTYHPWDVYQVYLRSKIASKKTMHAA